MSDNERKDWEPPELSSTVITQIEQICASFRGAMAAGEDPEIESFLCKLSVGDDEAPADEARAYLLYALIITELECRRERDETTDAATKYYSRFPGDESVVLAAFRYATGADELRKVPRKIGRYKVLDLVGEGSFAKVFLAYDEIVERNVAIKVPKSGVYRSRAAAKRFLSEAKLAQELHHQGIVGIYNADFDSRCGCYVVMQYIEGRDLNAWRLCTPSFAKIANLMATLADAMVHAHGKKIIHRDLKPANIIVDSDDIPHIMDFGLALHRFNRHEHIGRISGTLSYISPEQLHAEPVDEKTDVWSLGVILYELLCGKRPFSGNPVDAHGKLKNRPTPPQTHDTSVPAALGDICLKCLVPRAQRITARELYDELRSYIDRPPPGPRQQVVVVVPGQLPEFDESKRQTLKDILSAFLRIPLDDVRIAGLDVGSVRVTVDLPARGAQKLVEAFEAKDVKLFECFGTMKLLDVIELPIQKGTACDHTATFLSEAIGRTKQMKAQFGSVLRILAFDETLAKKIQDAAAGTAKSSNLRDVVTASDPLLLIAAGDGEETVVETSPPWYTVVAQPPVRLSWDVRESGGPWAVRLWCPRGGELFAGTVADSRVDLRAIHDAIPHDTDVRWEIAESIAQSEQRMLVRGVFRVAKDEQMADVSRQLREREQKAGGALETTLAIAAIYHDARMFEASLDCLRRLEQSTLLGTNGFLVGRAFTSVYVAIHRELTGGRRLGYPEGIWAINVAERHLTKAYAAIGVRI